MTKKISDKEIAQYNAKHRKNRDIDTFIGICIGMLCDGNVNEVELNYLVDWINRNPHIADEYPVSKITNRIGLWLKDGKIDEHEEIELLKVLTSIAEPANTPTDEPARTEDFLSDIFCTPEPDIFIYGARISFTGDSDINRDDLINLVTSLGATVAKKEISGTTDFLVIAGSASPNWKHTTGGTKIVKAMEIKNRGGKIKIVREEYFLNKLKSHIDALTLHK